MVRKKYTEEQFIIVLNEAEAGARQPISAASRHERRDLLILEGQVRRPDGERAQEATVHKGFA